MRKSLNSLTRFEPSPFQQIAFALPLAPAPALPESLIDSCKLVAASRLLRLGLSTVSACFIQSLFISILSWFSFFLNLAFSFTFLSKSWQSAKMNILWEEVSPAASASAGSRQWSFETIATLQTLIEATLTYLFWREAAERATNVFFYSLN